MSQLEKLISRIRFLMTVFGLWLFGRCRWIVGPLAQQAVLLGLFEFDFLGLREIAVHCVELLADCVEGLSVHEFQLVFRQ